MAELRLERAMGLTPEELSILHHEVPVDVFSRGFGCHVLA